MKKLNYISTDQIEKWRKQIIKLQDNGRHDEVLTLWNNIIQTRKDADIKNLNDLEAIANFFDDETILKINGL
jgi:hypothetical protein